MTERRWRWIWQADLGEGAEDFRFRAADRGFETRGEVAATLEGEPLRASYLVETDAMWRTRRVRVDVRGGGALEILSDGVGHWRHPDGAALHELDGCLDPDISMTPFTNTVAIRCTRLADRLWRFDGLDIDFTADITVDEEGFVMDYPGLFQREF